MFLRVCCLICFICLGFDASAEDELPTTRLSPQMKVTDRDWSYFRAIPCSDLQNVAVHSEREKQLLDRRRQQCLDKYRAFAPKSGVR